MERNFRVVFEADEPVRFARLMEKTEFVNTSPLRLGLDAPPDPVHRSFSFIVLDSAVPVAVVACRSIAKADFLSNGLSPLVICKSRYVTGPLNMPVVERVANVLRKIATDTHRTSILLGDGESVVEMTDRGPSVTPGMVSRYCQAKGMPPFILSWGSVDLSHGEAGVHKHLRKSFRSLVNWGRKNMRLRYYNAETPDRDLLLRDFAFLRDDSPYHPSLNDLVRDEFTGFIESGHAELCIGNLDDYGPVAATLTTWTDGEPLYHSGVYRKVGDDLPVSHWPVYDAILRSAERGHGRYHLGRLWLYDGDLYGDEKKSTISFFKKGFATDIDHMCYWLDVVERA